MSTPKARQRLLLNGGLFVLLVLLVITITSVYVSNEHTFYWWDYSTYQNLTRDKAIDFRETPINALSRTWKSTMNDYSDIPTLLLVPFILTFGDSRLVYVLSIALVYLLPFALVLGAIAAKLIPSYPRTVYWSTALLTLLTPVAWAPTLRGYVDTGAALLIALAILVYLQDFQLKNRWQIALIGFFIAAAILFRRHFIYDGIAFFVAIALQTLITFSAQVRQRSHQAWRNLFKRSVRIGCTVASSLITLVILGLPFILKILTTNFSLLYTSFEVPFDEGLRYYGSSYGWITWMLAGLGFAAGLLTRVITRSVAIFIILFGSFSLMQWVLIVKQVGVHYTSHFTLLVVLGLVAFGWTAWITLKERTRTLVLSVSGIYLIFNAVIGLASVDILNNTPLRPTRFGMSLTPVNIGTKLSELFSANYPPLKRADYDEVARLVEYLHTVAPDEEPIYIAAASDIFNSHLVENAYPTLHKGGSLNILPSPDMDSRDFYPLESLLQAQYVVVATPVHYQVRPTEQEVVKVVVDAFTENWEIAQDFTRLTVQFALAKGTVVNVYKRSRSTSLETALRTLIAMQNYIGTRPGGQSDWIKLSEVPGHAIYRKRFQDNYFLETSNHEARATSFLYIGTLPAQVGITGKLTYNDNWCAGASLRFDAINEQGEVIDSTKLVHYPTNVPNFTLPLQAQNADYLLFNISVANDKNDATNHCSVRISPLDIEG